MLTWVVYKQHDVMSDTLLHRRYQLKIVLVMFICKGHSKKVIHLQNFGPLSGAMDWMLAQCRECQRKDEKIWLEFQNGEYFPILNDENIYMAVEMVVRYYTASLDDRDFPGWMQEMDVAWEIQNEFIGDEDSSSDSASDYEDFWDDEWYE